MNFWQFLAAAVGAVVAPVVLAVFFVGLVLLIVTGVAVGVPVIIGAVAWFKFEEWKFDRRLKARAGVPGDAIPGICGLNPGSVKR